jgi:hypothetical protein
MPHVQALALSRLKPRERAELFERQLPPLPSEPMDALSAMRYAQPAPMPPFGHAYQPVAGTRHNGRHQKFRLPY